MLNKEKIASFNESYLVSHKQNLSFLGENLSKKNLDLNTVINKVSDFQIAIRLARRAISIP